MALDAIRSWRDALKRGSFDSGLYFDGRGTMQLAPTNLWPNQYALDVGPNGEPARWSLSWNVERLLAYHAGLSRPGSPKLASVTRQDAAAIPPQEGSYRFEEPWVAGMKGTPASKRKPPTPEIVAVPNGSRGFEEGDFGWAWAERNAFGPTTPTAFRYFHLRAGEAPSFPRPDHFQPGTTHWDIILTRRNGGPSSAVLFLSVPIELLRDEFYPAAGPWKNRGKPASSNLSGVGQPPKPKKGEYGLTHSEHDTLAGFWSPMRQVATPRGTTLLSPAGAALKVVADWVRVKVEGPAPQNATSLQDMAARGEYVYAPDGEAGSGAALSASAQGGPDDPDPRRIRPPGKVLAEETDDASAYAGEELDFGESRLVGLLNDERAALGLPALIVSQVLNRVAYRRHPDSPGGEDSWPLLRRAREEGYEGEEAREEAVRGETPEEVARGLAGAEGRHWRGVGVAKEGDSWLVVLSEPIEDPEYSSPDVLYCEHVGADGTVTRHAMGDADAHAAVSQGWNLVKTFEDGSRSMRWAYGGSYRFAVSCINRWDGKSSVRVGPGSDSFVAVAITDGSLASGIGATTYSDGRMILNSYYFGIATANHNNAICVHEGGHCVGLDHVTGIASVMQPSFTREVSTNPEYPTDYDVSEVRRIWGAPSATNPPPPTTQPSQPAPNAPTGEQQNEIKQIVEQNQTNIQRSPGDPQQTPDPAAPEQQQPQYHYVFRRGTHKKKAALYLSPPAAILKRAPGSSWAPWWLHEDESGKLTLYQAVPAGAVTAQSRYFDGTGKAKGLPKGTVVVPGLSSEEAVTLDRRGRGPAVRLVSEEAPEEDTTVLDAPDSTTVPDAPDVTGQEVLPAGRYVATVQGVLEGGGLTQHSDLASGPNGPYVDITAQQMPKLILPRTVSRVKNASWSLKDRNGNPEDWTFENAGTNQPGYFRAEGGVLTLGTTQATGLNPKAFGDPIPFDPGQPVTVAGTVGARRLSAGVARVALRLLKEDGTPLLDASGNPAEVFAHELPTTGEARFEKVYPANAFDPNARFLAPSPRLGLDSSGTANGEVYFHPVRVLPFEGDVRRLEETPGEPADFDPAPDVLVPADAYVAVGPAPESQAAPAPDVPPYEVVGFEGGAWPDQGPWAENLSPGLTSRVIPVGTYPMFGSYAWRVADTTTGRQVVAYRQKTFFPPAGVAGDALALRFLFYVDGVMPNYGRIALGTIVTETGRPIATVLLSARGTLILWIYAPNGSVLVEAQAAYGVAAGTLADVEVAVSGGGTKQGVVTCGVGLNGARRYVPLNVGNNDFTGRLPRLVRVGLVNKTDLRDRSALVFDQLVVTERGDVPDRERPLPPSGYVPPPPDMPKKGADHRRYDKRGNRINQLVAFLPPGSAPPEDPAICRPLDEPVTVRPGMPHTIALFSSYSLYGADAPGLRVILRGEGKDDLTLPCVPFSGRRKWDPDGRPGEDDFAVFDVPEGYTEAIPEFVWTDGFYVHQEPLIAPGALASFASRDAARGYGRAAAGTGDFVLDALPEGYEEGPQFGAFLSEVGARVVPDETPVGALSALVSTGADRQNWLPYSGPGSAAMRLVRVSVSMTGDGEEGPEVAAGGIYARTWCPVAVLLREDGSHFPGGAYIFSAVSPSDYPEVDWRTVGGRLVPVPVTDSIGRIGEGVEVGVGTEAAKQEIEYLSSIGPLRAEVPTSGGTVAGEGLLVLFKAGLRLKAAPVPPRVAEVLGGASHRIMYFKGSSEETQWMERGPLQPPMLPAVSPVQLALVGA